MICRSVDLFGVLESSKTAANFWTNLKCEVDNNEGKDDWLQEEFYFVCVCVCVYEKWKSESVRHSVLSDSLRHYGL